MKSALPKKTSILYWFSYFLFAILPITINAQTAPGAPTIGWATATGATSATVSFTAPTNNGGSPILRYVATSSPGGITGIFTGAGSGTITITGLTSDTPYNFTITAVNAVGSSIPSEVSNWVVPVRGPNEPTNVVAVAGNEQASISFTPPTDDGGTPIFMYMVVASPGNIMMSGISSPIIVPGLRNGTAYTFVVSAENSMGGQGTPSAPSNSVTPGTPDAPTIGTATATGFTTATVAFTAASNNGGSAITSYEVTSSPAGGTGTFNGAGSGTISVSNLTHSTNYTFTVKARNTNGFGKASAASNQITTPTPITAPDAPTIGAATATGPTTATVAFTAPSNNGGSAITGYVVTSSPAGGAGTFYGAGSGTISVSNLAPSTSYTFTVKAVNGIGSSNASAASNQITTPSIIAPTAPAQPMVAGQPSLAKFTAVGADAGGGPLVTITFTNGTYVSFFAYASSFLGGVRVALGDINGDGNMDVITGAGPGGGPQVNVYNVNPSTGAVSLQKSFFAFSAPSFTGGVYVATGRTNADDFDDIIVGAGATGGSRVQVYAGSATGAVTTSTLNDFFAYSPAFTGGVRVAAGDRNGDGVDEVITAPASNGGYNIKSFNTNGKGNSPTVIDNFFAFNNTTSVGGLSIASGYLNNGNISDIIVGTSNSEFGVILDSNTAGIAAAIPFAGFINVGVAEDANGIIYPMALAGPGGAPRVTVYKTGVSSLAETDNLFVMNVAFRGGLFGTPGIRRSNHFGPSNSAPSNITLSTATISENNAIDASIGTLASTDPDAGDSFTYSLVSGAGSTDNSKFTITGNTLKAAEAFDYETKSSYKIRIQTRDAGGLSFQKEFTLTIVNVNEAPTAIALSNATIDENNAIDASIGTLASTDQDAGDSFTYSLVNTYDLNGARMNIDDNDKFTIAGSTLRATEAFDYETKSSYKIRIQTSDAAGLSFQKEFTLTIANVNEAPTAIALSNATIDENNAVGASIGTLASTDPDAGDSFTYSLVSGAGSTDNSKFTLSGNTLGAKDIFDFEAKSSYSIRIQTTDAGGLSFQKTLSISITDVNETPSAMAITKSNLYESNTINQVVGALSTSDQDAGDSHTYSLVSGVGSTDNAAFNVSGNQIRASQVFSFATKNSYSIRVRTTDKGGLSFEKVYTVSISQLPTLTGTGNEYGTQIQAVASATPKISKGLTSKLNVSGIDMASFNWSPSASLSSANIYNPVAQPSQTQSYSVTVTNVYGSSTTLSITVEVMEDWNIVPNNILTPNGDGVNDNWVIENLSSYPNNQLIILDRSNVLIYKKSGYANDWTGLFNGAPLPSGTYYYVLTFDSPSGQKVSKRGFITITK